MEAEAIVEAGRTEDVKLLLLRSNLKEEDMATVEMLLAKKDVEMAKAMEEKHKAIAAMAAVRLRRTRG